MDADFLSMFNQNTYIAAISMMVMNMGGRYLAMDMTKAQESLWKNKWARRLTVFCILYVATRDVKVSLAFLAVYMVVMGVLLHEESSFCMIPHSARRAPPVTEEEYAAAKRVVAAYEAARAEGDATSAS